MVKDSFEVKGERVNFPSNIRVDALVILINALPGMTDEAVLEVWGLANHMNNKMIRWGNRFPVRRLRMTTIMQEASDELARREG